MAKPPAPSLWRAAPVLLVLLSSLLVGCSGETSSSSSTTTAPESPPSTLDPSFGELTLTWVSSVATGQVLITRRMQPGQPSATLPVGERDRTFESIAWAPDGSALVYDSDVEGNFEIYVLPAGQTSPVNLSRNPANEGWPVWSPDSSRIAFFSNRDGQYEPFVMRADGSDVRKLAPSDVPVSSLTWSPDGSRVLYVAQDPRTPRIMSVPVDGSGPAVEAIAQPGRQGAPSFSADGRSLAYMAQLPDEEIAFVWVADADGSNPRRLTDHTEPERHPQFSPDGTRMLYLRTVEGDEGGTVDVIVIRRMDDGSEVVATDNSVFARHARWSPDGAFIAYTANRGRDDEVVVVSADGSAAVNVSGNGNGPDMWPTWFPFAGATNPFPTG